MRKDKAGRAGGGHQSAVEALNSRGEQPRPAALHGLGLIEGWPRGGKWCGEGAAPRSRQGRAAESAVAASDGQAAL